LKFPQLCAFPQSDYPIRSSFLALHPFAVLNSIRVLYFFTFGCRQGMIFCPPRPTGQVSPDCGLVQVGCSCQVDLALGKFVHSFPPSLFPFPLSSGDPDGIPCRRRLSPSPPKIFLSSGPSGDWRCISLVNLPLHATNEKMLFPYPVSFFLRLGHLSPRER